nr:hypothetical protein ZK39.1 - Caenorhabditis elegans [Caenorhabditis elegans]
MYPLFNFRCTPRAHPSVAQQHRKRESERRRCAGKSVCAKTLLKLPSNAPPGWLISDLQFQNLIGDSEIATLQPSIFSTNFEVEDGYRIITNTTVTQFHGELFELFLNVKEQNFQRLVTLHVYVDPRGTSQQPATFLSTVYHATVYTSQQPGSTVVFSKPITVRNRKNFVISPISKIDKISKYSSPFSVMTRGKSVDIVMMKQKLEEDDITRHVIFLGAFTEKTGEMASVENNVIAQTKVIIDVIDSGDVHFLLKSKKSIAKFASAIPANSTVFDVEKRNLSEPLLFHLEEPSRFFKIDQFSGRVSTVLPVGYGTYHIHVVARNQKKQRSDAWLEISVKKEQKLEPMTSSRSRRHLDDIVFRIPENTTMEDIEKKDMPVSLNQLKFFCQKIPLFAGETIGEINVAKEWLKIDDDGKIHLLKPLNYEKTSSIIATVPINGLQSSEFLKILQEMSRKTENFEFTLKISKNAPVA